MKQILLLKAVNARFKRASQSLLLSLEYAVNQLDLLSLGHLSLSVVNQTHFVFLFLFYGISIIVGYLMPNPFYTNNQFYIKQSVFASLQSLIVKNISISNYLV